MEKKPDLRTVKTKKNIRESFLQLAREKDVQKISVKEICALAQCSRNTFYMYYPYKEALFSEIVDSVVAEIAEGFFPIDSYAPGPWGEINERYIRNILLAMRKLSDVFPLIPPQSEMFRLLLDRLFYRIVNYASEDAIGSYAVFDSRRREPGQRERTVITMMLRFLFGGVISFGLYWLTETDYPLEEALEVLRPEFRAAEQALEQQLLDFKATV